MVMKKTPIKSPVACFSFDDGFDEVTTQIAPILADLGTNCCIFINPGFIDAMDTERSFYFEERFHLTKSAASWEELKWFVDRGGVIGSHTNTHSRLSHIDHDIAQKELIQSKATIENKLKIECRYFAWPYGTASDVTREQLDIALMHYDLVFSAIRTPARFFYSDRVINRDHFEGNWKYSNIKYFLSMRKSLDTLDFDDAG